MRVPAGFCFWDDAGIPETGVEVSAQTQELHSSLKEDPVLFFYLTGPSCQNNEFMGELGGGVSFPSPIISG